MTARVNSSRSVGWSARKHGQVLVEEVLAANLSVLGLNTLELTSQVVVLTLSLSLLRVDDTVPVSFRLRALQVSVRLSCLVYIEVICHFRARKLD